MDKQEILYNITKRFPNSIKGMCEHTNAPFIPFHMIVLDDTKMAFLFDTDVMDDKVLFLTYLAMFQEMGWQLENTMTGHYYFGVVGTPPNELLEIAKETAFIDNVIGGIDFEE